MRIIDLRSDTVTKPSPEMWSVVKSWNDSKLGDDVMREDPTVNELEMKAAKKLRKEAALFVSSGTQGNLISLLSQTTPGDEIMVEEESHIFGHEVGSAARIGGLMIRTYSSERGFPSLKKLQTMIRDSEDIHEPPSKLLCAENTHNYHGGTIIKPEELKEMRDFALKNNLKFHLDGARIFNASVASNLPITDFTKHADSVMFCLSKGLSCPVGSMVVGSKDFIDRARKYRKMLGGGMRQAGIIASFGLVALEDKWINRLNEDHNNAKRLADGLLSLNLSISVQKPETNILMVYFPDNAPIKKIILSLQSEGVLAYDINQKIRFVTHFGIDEDGIDFSIEKIGNVLKKMLN
ncbi:MAG TPA: GntG family PLP-dependent aldolase [candidate division Zixibacteria bacterium]|nr:GntG family PLP-dependent aldolase [candidate division Zixibacteria bacterium]